MWKRFLAILASPMLIVLAAFVLRAGMFYNAEIHAAPARTATVPFGYEVGRVARSVAEGRGFSSPLAVESGPTAWFTPVYPLILAGVFKVFGVYTHASVIVAVILNSIFSALGCWPVYLIGQRVFGRGVGIVAAWGWAFLPSATGLAIHWVWDTSLSALLMTLILLATLHVAGSSRWQHWAGYGLLWALGGLTNPALLSLLPFLIGWAALQNRARAQSWLRLAATASLAFLLAVFPWFVRNYLAFGQVVLFRSNFGLELWLGNNDLVPDVWTPYQHPNENAAELERFKQLGEIPYMAEKSHLAIEFIRSHPVDFAGLVAFRFMNNWTNAWDQPTRLFPRLSWQGRTALLGNALFSLLAFAGVFFAQRARLDAAFPFACMLLVFPLAYYLTHTALRYRHPVDPAMTVLATYAVACLFGLVAHKPHREPVRAATQGSQEFSDAR